jgi:hypothetical protein
VAEAAEATKASELAQIKQDTRATIAAAKKMMGPAVDTATTLSPDAPVPAIHAEQLVAATTELDALERRLAG